KGTLFFTHDFHQIDSCPVSANSATCTPTPFLDTGSSPTSYPAHLTTNGDLLYFVKESGSSRIIQACPTSGCTVTGYPKSGLDSPAILNGVPVAGLVVTDTNLYVSSFTGGIFKFTMTSAEAAAPQSGAQAVGSNYGTGGLDTDGKSLFWAESDGRIQTCALPE